MDVHGDNAVTTRRQLGGNAVTPDVIGSCRDDTARTATPGQDVYE